MTRFAIAITATFVMLIMTAAPSSAQNLRACTNPPFTAPMTAERASAITTGAIAACTRLLQTARLTAKQRYDVLIARGNYYMQFGTNEQRIADLSDAIRIMPERAEAYLWRGQSHRDNDRHREAIADLTQAIRNGSQLQEASRQNAYWMRAYSYEALKDTDGAIAAWTAAIEAKGFKTADDTPLRQRAALYRDSGQPAKAIADHTAAIAIAAAAARNSPHGNLTDQRPFIHIERARAYAAMGQYGAAISDFDEAARLNPANADSAYFYNLRAQTHEAAGNMQRSLADYRKADAKEPNNSDTLAAIARLENAGLGRVSAAHAQPSPAAGPVRKTDRRDCLESFGGGDHEISIPACTRLLAARNLKEQDRLKIMTMRAAWYDRAGRIDDAIAQYIEIMKQSPTKEASFGLANAYQLKGNFDKAIAVMTDHIGSYRDDPDGYHTRANLYADKHEYDKAIADMTSKIRVGGRDAGDYGMRAEFWHRKGDIDRAIADFSEALKVSPRDQSSLERRARLYDEKGDMHNALEDFRRALAVDPPTGKAMGIEKHIARLERDIAAGFKPETKVVTANPGRPQALAPVTENRIALVIGNSAYRHNVALANPRADAEALAATLKRIGFKSVDLKLDLTREQLVDALRQFAGEAAKADWAVIYFAGHGLQIGGINYLIPVDAKLASDRDVSFEAVAMEHVLNAVEGARKLRLAILDACRDNPFVKSMTRSLATRSLGRGLAAIEPQRSTLVAFAARDGQVALDGAGANSPFASALIRHLDAPGLEINLLFRKVRDDVLKLTGNDQEPFTYGSLSSEALYFRPVAAAR